MSSRFSMPSTSSPAVRSFGFDPPQRRSPLINIGTVLRCTAIDSAVAEFLSTNPATPKQILSIGAGSDSRYWRIMVSITDPDACCHRHQLVH
jgi:[phosphatase 2A protein]-leucine-carboxy methyltransferase